MTPAVLARSGLAGIGVGIVYALSPLTVWVAALAVLLFRWIVTPLAGRERRVIAALLLSAAAVRLLLVIGLFLTVDLDRTLYASFFFEPDGLYMKIRSLWMRNIWLGLPVEPEAVSGSVGAFTAPYGWTGYLYLIAYLQYLLGPAPYAIHIFNGTLYMAGAAILHRLARPAFGRVAAAGGLAIVLFMPSLLLWSISAMKESLQFAMGAAAVAAAVAIVRARSQSTRAAAAAAFVSLLAVLGTIRPVMLVGGVAGLGAGLVIGVTARRPRLLAVGAAIAALIVLRAATLPTVQAAVLDQVRQAGVVHLGNVRTEGHHYKLLDGRFYELDDSSLEIRRMTPAEAARFVARAAATFALVPLPWQAVSKTELAYLPQQLVWYVLIVLAVIGIAPAWRRDPLFTALLVGYGAMISVIVALNSGNIGTMVRHRDGVVPFLAFVSATGAVRVLAAAAIRLSSAAVERREATSACA